MLSKASLFIDFYSLIDLEEKWAQIYHSNLADNIDATHIHTGIKINQHYFLNSMNFLRSN